MTEPRSHRDTDPDEHPLFLESRSLPSLELDDLSREDSWTTTTEPLPAPVFRTEMRRLERSVVLGSVTSSAIMGAAVVVAAWILS